VQQTTKHETEIGLMEILNAPSPKPKSYNRSSQSQSKSNVLQSDVEIDSSDHADFSS